jgi:uncharacterized protein (TIGR03118 family)
MRTQADSKTQGSNLTPGFEAGFDDPGFETQVPESIPSNSQKGELKMKFKAMILGMLTILGVCSTAFAQQTGYSQTNLVANTAGVANHTDAQLSNPWGISFIPGQPFWIANNNGGTSTLYDAQGNKQSLVVGIPSASMNPCNPGCPTGTVANSVSGYFGGGAFLFDTEDGIIANWTGQANAVVAVDNSATGAVYKGLALLTNNAGIFLLAANFNSGRIDVFDRNFNPTHLTGSFTDPNLPAGFAPHGIHVIDNVVWVTYGMQNAAKHDPTPGAGLGIVDTFDVNGNFTATFATGGNLNAPWGVVVAPATFGTFANDVLIGNFGDGTINAFDNTGHFLAQVTDSANHVITNPGLWDMVFGAGGTGDPNTLYFTAGGANQTSGLFATLVPAAVVTNANFSLSLATPTVTVAPGSSAMVTVNSSAVGGFNGQIALSCLPAAGLTCSFSPATISPGSSSALTVTASSTVPAGGRYGKVALALLPGLGLLGTFFTARRRKLGVSKGKSVLMMAGLAVLVVGMTFTVACGSNSSSHATTTNNQATVMVQGTSGAISHAIPMTVNVQ